MRAKYTVLMPAPPPEGAADATALAKAQAKAAANMIPADMIPQ